MTFKVTVKAVDSLGQQSDLYDRGTRVFGMRFVFCDNV